MWGGQLVKPPDPLDTLPQSLDLNHGVGYLRHRNRQKLLRVVLCLVSWELNIPQHTAGGESKAGSEKN